MTEPGLTFGPLYNSLWAINGSSVKVWVNIGLDESVTRWVMSDLSTEALKFDLDFSLLGKC